MSGIMVQDPYMSEAVKEALDGITQGHGGPFGTVIVRDGRIVGHGHNRVLKDHDPTAHGEITAIRDAAKKLGTHDLSGCELYTTGEPCPMCLFACMWANIKKVYYGCTIADNALIGFRDEAMDSFVRRDILPEGFLEEKEREACLELFRQYEKMSHENY